MAWEDNFAAFAAGFSGQPSQARLKRQQQAEFEEQQRRAAELKQQQDSAAARGLAAQYAFQNPDQPRIDPNVAMGLAQIQEGLGTQAAFQAMQNPAFNPAVAEQQQLLQQQQDRITALAPVRKQANILSNVLDMKELLANEGKIVAPGAAKGAYNSLRGFMLNDLRAMFEAGALQQAELDFFKSMLPDAASWASLSQDERMAMLNEMQYQYGLILDDAIATSGTDVTRADVMRQPRAWQDIVGKSIPENFVEYKPEELMPVDPGGGWMPFGMFFKQLGL